MADWIYILKPNKETLDGEPSDKETIRRLAHEDPELDLWLSRRNRMSWGDRLGFFFSNPESTIAAVKAIDGEPYEDPDDPDFTYRVDVTLLPEATDALYGNPVGREALGLGQVRSVQKVKPQALPVLLGRAVCERTTGAGASPRRFGARTAFRVTGRTWRGVHAAVSRGCTERPRPRLS